ncbi:aminotransferase-like domain-containing protein [Shewanella gaetbuli]
MLRPWETQFWLEESDDTLHSRLLNRLLQDIKDGRLPAGSPLPGSRTLAKQLAVNRKTVQGVYNELEAQGWITTKLRSGTFIADVLPETSLSKSHQALLNLTDEAPVTSSLFTGLYNDSLPSSHIPHNANDGSPDTRLIPYEVLARAYRRACITLSRNAYLGYGDPKGSLELRKSIHTMLSVDRFMKLNVEDICLVRGSQMGLYLTACVLQPQKGVIIVEELCYQAAITTFEAKGFDIIRCKLDQQGLVIDDLNNILSTTKVAAVYVTPHHQYPTTVCLPMNRRLQILQLSKSHQFAIIEDDYDHEFHYENRPIPPLASLPGAENVIHIGSLSKVFAPGLRVGYMAAQRPFIDKIAQQIMLIDRQGNTVTEYAIADLMESGEVKKHIRKACKLYQQRRDFAVSEFKRVFGNKVTFNVPSGGLALWVNLSPMIKHLDADNLIDWKDSSANFYFCPREHTLHLRFGYGATNNHEITQSIKALQVMLLKIEQE